MASAAWAGIEIDEFPALKQWEERMVRFHSLFSISVFTTELLFPCSCRLQENDLDLPNLRFILHVRSEPEKHIVRVSGGNICAELQIPGSYFPTPCLVPDVSSYLSVVKYLSSTQQGRSMQHVLLISYFIPALFFVGRIVLCFAFGTDPAPWPQTPAHLFHFR